MRAHQINLFTCILIIHLPSLKCPETMKMQPKHNAVCHVLRWVTFVTHQSLVGVNNVSYGYISLLLPVLHTLFKIGYARQAVVKKYTLNCAAELYR